MEWLAQNWIWLVLAAGAVWFVAHGRRGGLMAGGCCGGHGGSHGDPARERPGSSHEGHHGSTTTAGAAAVAGQGADAPAKQPEHAHGQRRGGCCG